MKHYLLFSAMLVLMLNFQTAGFANEIEYKPSFHHNIEGKNYNSQHIQKQDMEKRRQEFEKRLKLTDEQKLKAKEIQEKGKKEIKPVMEEIRLKREEIRKIENSFHTDKEKQALITPLRNDVKELNKKAHKMKVQNMKEFEGILSEKQLKELEKMKKEGAKNFEKNIKMQKNEFKPPFLTPPHNN